MYDEFVETKNSVMPPLTRKRATKKLKQSVDVVKKTKVKSDSKVTKPPRKPLADKTNSLSDDNASIDVPRTKTSKVVMKNKAVKVPEDSASVRPRRNRRLPTRYVENEVLINLSISNSNSTEHNFTKTQTKSTTSSSKDKASPDNNNNSNGKRILAKKVLSTKSPREISTKSTKELSTKSSKELSIKSPSKQSTKLPTKQIIPKADTKVGFGKRLLEKNLSFRVFEDRKPEDKDEDIYEFTYDPNEEPTPQKKKRKKIVKKRPPKPKTVVLKNNYEKNLKITLESLKNKIKPFPSQNTQPQYQNVQPQSQNVQPQSQNVQPQSQNVRPQSQNIHLQSQNIQPQSQNMQPPLQKQPLPQYEPINKNPAKKIQVIEDIILKPASEKALNYTPALPTNESAKSIHMSNYASICVEDIAADFETMHNNDMDYSPVNSPCRPETPMQLENNLMKAPIAVDNRDPLNLQGDMSFDDQPVASSSMNVSVRHPLASPWRVEFGNLPIRWQANSYVKPNMTPAVESSFINSESSSKKHVYTNMLADEPLPQAEEPHLKQPSIISFMREVAERSLKKKRGRSISPTKENSLFEDMSNTSNFGFKTPKKARKEMVISTPNCNISDDKSCEEKVSNHSGSHDNSISNQNHDENSKNESSNSEKSKENVSSTKKSKNKENTFFGFDESESYDQENISPVKNVRHTRARGMRAKSRGILQEINAMSGPTRAILPKPKLASTKVEQLYHQLKASEVPVLPEKENVADEAIDESSDDDGLSVHLFEDIEVVHHLKPQRKSYGKAKKVTFRQRSNSDDDTQTQVSRSSFEDDLADLTFRMPNVKERKVTKRNKPKLSKKEFQKEEVEQWAAGFNSMCEDIDEFALVVE